MDDIFLKKTRKTEIDSLRDYFRRGMSVLEIGGGNGYQASIIASWGCSIVSLDIPQNNNSREFYYVVQNYDGKNIPFVDSSFDIVFPSSTLEHIYPKDLGIVLKEAKRVLRPDGLFIVILPNSIWRFWTIIYYYIFIMQQLLFNRCQYSGILANKKIPGHIGIFNLAKKILFPGSHGEYANSFSELYYFSKRRWDRVFINAGFKVVKYTGNNLFYSGYHYQVSPKTSVKNSCFMAKILGSVCHVFILSVKCGKSKK